MYAVCIITCATAAGFFESRLTPTLLTQVYMFFYMRMVFLLPMICVVCAFSNSKLKDEQNKQKISPQSYETKIKSFASFGLASEQRNVISMREV